jgi:hypothetical protein
MALFYLQKRRIEQASGLQLSCDERILQDVMNVRSGPEIVSAIHYANPIEEASGSAPPSQPVQMAERLPHL